MIRSINTGLGYGRLILKISFILGFIFIIGLESCFEEIDTVKLDPLETFTAVNSIETLQTYYKIDENEIRLVGFNNPGTGILVLRLVSRAGMSS